MTQRTVQGPLVVICGTNASGKSSLGITLAEKFNGEIISADSRQIYHGFDLCCGKVTAEERERVPHHLLDVAEVGDHFDVSEYQQKAYEAMEDIQSRGKLPFLVGGTGLYVDAVVRGFDFSSGKGDRDWRDVLEEKPVSELQAMLSDKALKKIRDNPSDFQNKRRLSRLIEKDMKGFSMEPENRPLQDVLLLGVTWPKEALHERIRERLEKRLSEGMLEEVGSYLSAGGDPEEMYSLGLEYRFIAEYLLGKIGSEEEFKTLLSTAIRQFAKRQVKWFKRNEEIHWIDMTQDPVTEASELIGAYLKEH